LFVDRQKHCKKHTNSKSLSHVFAAVRLSLVSRFFECVLNCLLTCSSWSNSIERLLYHFCLEMSNYKPFTRIRAFVAVAHICSDLWDRCFLASSYWLLCTRCCVIIFFVS
jgi:hypothetical protein